MQTKLGLVLSGGGAKGAYEVGVIRALAVLGIEPDVISGASIGAVNGALIAGASNMQTAADELSMVWNGLDREKILKSNISGKRLLVLSGLHTLVRRYLKMNPVTLFAKIAADPLLGLLLKPEDRTVISLLDQSPLEEILEQSVDFSHLLSSAAKELYVAIFPSGNGNSPDFWKPLAKYAAGEGSSAFIRVKDCPRDALKLIMASAAIPIAYKPAQIDGQWYYDGGMGGRVTAQGNTPATPLLKCGCTHAIVVMLCNGVLWDRHEWPSVTALEIRPKNSMKGLFSMLDFTPQRIQELISLGYRDAMDSIGKVSDAMIRHTKQKQAEANMLSSVYKCLEDSRKYEAELSRHRVE